MQDENLDLLDAAIAALERCRVTLGDAVVEQSLAPLLGRRAALLAGGQVPTDASSSDSAGAAAAQEAAGEPVRRLRQVSVLFLDIVGSTQLIRDLDPEEVQAVVDGALAAFTQLVLEHGGEVLRYAGDNLKAAFGADRTRDDDAERAVNCGLALLREAARRGVAVRQQHGHEGFDARVGVHTGAVVRGGGIEHDKSLTGLAVNVAARMEQAAAPGTLRISMDTYRQVQGCFDVQEQPALQVKGLKEPMRTFLVRGALPRRLRGLRHGADGVASELVGRDDELGQLQSLAAAVFSPAGTLRAATVLGEAGLGKSRLLAEFQAGLPAETRASMLWRASSHPQGLHQPYGLLLDLLFWHLGVRDSDTQAQAQQTFAAGLAPVFGSAADEQTALLGQLIGMDYSASPFIAGILRDGKQLQARGLHAWVQYWRAQAAQQPLVLVLDDLQWADDGSLDAIEQLVAEAHELPIVLLCAARPELLQRRPDWASNWPAHTQLTLSPLAGQGSQALAAALTSRFASPVPVLQALLAQQAAGNPYYMEALLQMLVDTGVIQTAGEHWQVQDDQLQGLKVPGTLVGVLQATLDALEADERRSLQEASVVGAQFWDGALAAIDPLAPDMLPSLGRRELALPQAQSAFEGTREYAFRHHLLHQVTYATVLKPDRRSAHGHAARWLQARSQGRENELASQIAEHFERAGDKEQAIPYWLRAAEDAAQRQADTSALAHAQRALALEDGSDLRRLVRLHRVRAQVFMRAGRSVEHAQTAAQLESLAERLDDDVLRLAIANDTAWPLFLSSRFEEAVEFGQRRLVRAEAQSPADAGRLHNVMSIALARLGRSDEALVHAHKGLEQSRTAGDRNTEAAILTNMGVADIDANRITQGLARYGQALATYKAAGSRNGVVNVTLNLAWVEETLGRMEKARDLLLQALQDSRELGARRFQGMAHANLAGVLCELGDFEASHANALEALRIAGETGDQRAEAFANRAAQMCCHATGRWSQALDHALAARTGFSSTGHTVHAWAEASMVACNLHAMGEPARALAEAEALLRAVAEEGGWGDCVDAPFHLYRVLAPLGDARAGALLAAAHQGLSAQADRYADQVPRDTFMRATLTSRGICDAWATSHNRAAGPGGSADSR